MLTASAPQLTSVYVGATTAVATLGVFALVNAVIEPSSRKRRAARVASKVVLIGIAAGVLSYAFSQTAR